MSQHVNLRNIIRNRKNKKIKKTKLYVGCFSAFFLCLGVCTSGIYKCFGSDNRICSPLFVNFFSN